MTRDDIIAYGKKRYGEQWIAKLAADLNYSTAAIYRLATGEVKTVTRRLELEMQALIRRRQFETLAKPEVRYE
jgi:hypothetical protein